MKHQGVMRPYRALVTDQHGDVHDERPVAAFAWSALEAVWRSGTWFAQIVTDDGAAVLARRHRDETR